MNREVAMTSQTQSSGAVMHEPGTGRGTWAMGSLFEHLLEPEQSRDRLGIALVTQPPGVATPLHRHTNEAEAFFVLEGRISYRAGEDDFELYDGCFIYLPESVPHAFRIRGDEPARILALTAPGGLLKLYDEVGIPAAEMRLPGEDGLPIDVEIPRWAEIGPRYGLEVVGPPIPE
jgi:quercetin dioxygenase-like cupin family protein